MKNLPGNATSKRSIARHWPMAAVLALWTVALALQFVLHGWQQRSAQLQEDTQLLQNRMLALQNAPAPNGPQPGTLEAFQSAFPEADLREQRTLSLFTLARNQNLRVNPVTLRALPAGTAGLVAYEINLPVTGTYPDLRGFIDHALMADPGLTLSSLKVQRKDVQVPTLEAQMVFTLWMRGGAAR